MRTPAAGRRRECREFRFVQPRRLLEQDVFPRPRGGDGFGGMQMIRCGDVDDVNVWRGEQSSNRLVTRIRQT